jgi:hypothetical protein
MKVSLVSDNLESQASLNRALENSLPLRKRLISHCLTKRAENALFPFLMLNSSQASLTIEI